MFPKNRFSYTNHRLPNYHISFFETSMFFSLMSLITSLLVYANTRSKMMSSAGTKTHKNIFFKIINQFFREYLTYSYRIFPNVKIFRIYWDFSIIRRIPTFVNFVGIGELRYWMSNKLQFLFWVVCRLAEKMRNQMPKNMKKCLQSTTIGIQENKWIPIK